MLHAGYTAYLRPSPIERAIFWTRLFESRRNWASGLLVAEEARAAERRESNLLTSCTLPRMVVGVPWTMRLDFESGVYSSSIQMEPMYLCSRCMGQREQGHSSLSNFASIVSASSHAKSSLKADEKSSWAGKAAVLRDWSRPCHAHCRAAGAL